MTFPCHAYTNQGQEKGAATWLRQFFGVFSESLKRGREPSIGRKLKSQLSNAEYHLTAGQMQRIIEAARSMRDKALIQLLAETGIRRSEAANLDVGDVRLTERLILIRQGKGMKSRLVPITDSLAKNLATLIESIPQGPVFRSRSQLRLSLRQVNRIVADAGRRAKVKNPNPKYQDITPHLFRHSFARLWKKKGGSIETLANILGHQNISTTWNIYGREGLEDIRSNYTRVMNSIMLQFPEKKENPNKEESK